jgi:hypothetical protein
LVVVVRGEMSLLSKKLEEFASGQHV